MVVVLAVVVTTLTAAQAVAAAVNVAPQTLAELLRITKATPDLQHQQQTAVAVAEKAPQVVVVRLARLTALAVQVLLFQLQDLQLLMPVAAVVVALYPLLLAPGQVVLAAAVLVLLRLLRQTELLELLILAEVEVVGQHLVAQQVLRVAAVAA